MSGIANLVVLKRAYIRTDFFLFKCFSEYNVRSWNFRAIGIEGELNPEVGWIRKESVTCQF